MKSMLIIPLMLLFCACRSDISANGIPNFAQVEAGVWRGGQPDKSGWAYLRSLGVTNVVKLNKDSESNDNVRGMEMHLYRAPISFAEQIEIGTINSNRLEEAILKVPKQGTYIHCEHGQDRTGLFVAMWRVRVNHWDKAKAQNEMLDHGFHKSLIGLWELWEDWKP